MSTATTQRGTSQKSRAFAGCATPTATRTFTDNESLKHEVMEKLKSDPDVSADDIFVSALNGTVTLDGTVPTYPRKIAAIKSIEHLAGVHRVVNNLVVRLTDAYSRPDSVIRDAAANAIALLTTVQPEMVNVTVRNGWLKLEGTVEHPGQKEASEIAVRHLPGIVGITNLISVKHLSRDHAVGREVGAMQIFAQGEE